MEQRSVRTDERNRRAPVYLAGRVMRDAVHTNDEAMQACLELARKARNACPPNPAVGALLVAPDGRVLGRGFTQPPGHAHAEIMALRDAAARGHPVAEATLYVTLEPCSHHGRTPPCCDAVVAAGIRQVVVSIEDPNPLVAGSGLARLRAAGIAVTAGAGAVESRELNIGFFSRMVRKTPWVRMKIAASLDGKTALNNGASQWITSEPARADGHAWRARASAVLTGVGTVLEDDPLLDVRLHKTQRQPHLVVVDSRLETPPSARLFGPQRTLLIYAAETHTERQRALEARGAQVIYRPGAGGKVDLASMLQDLAAREVNEVHVEAGHKLNGSLIREGLVDEFLVYLAPKLLGPGRDMAALQELTHLGGATALEFISATMVGGDLRLLARIPGRDSF